MDVNEGREAGNGAAGGAIWLRRAALAAAGLLVAGTVLAIGSVRAGFLRRHEAAAALQKAGFVLEFEPEPHFLEDLFPDAACLRPLQMATCRNLSGKPVALDEPLGRALAVFPECRRIDVVEHRLTTPFVVQLQRLPKLSDLAFHDCEATDEQCREIAKIPSLVYLNLARNPRIGDAGARALQPLARLKSLDLSSTSVGDDALATPLAPNLEALDLSRTQATAVGIAKLATWPALRCVVVVDLPVALDGSEAKLLLAAGKHAMHVGTCVEPSFYPRIPHL